MSRKAAWILVGVLGAAVLVPQVVYAATGAFSSSSSSTALSATNSGSGRALNATSKTGYAGVFTRTATSGSTATIYSVQKSASSGASALFGYATSTGSGSTYGVYGRSAASNGRGVFGYATRSSGATTGVYGRTLSVSDGAAGVFGFASGSTLVGAICGVCGESSSFSGIGIGGFSPGIGNLGQGLIGLYGIGGSIGDGSLGVFSEEDAGFAGHVFGSPADGLGRYDFAGTCTVADATAAVDCIFKHSFPSGTTPVVVVTPTSNPGAFYWVGAPSSGTAADAFSINFPGVVTGAKTFNYMVVGLDSNVVPASMKHAASAATAAFASR